MSDFCYVSTPAMLSLLFLNGLNGNMKKTPKTNPATSGLKADTGFLNGFCQVT